jgi:hypothetical protein
MTLNHRKKAALGDRFAEVLRALPFVLGLLIATEKEARAYTDPGTGALVWQMIAAAFVGLMFYLRKFTGWFKTRKRDTKD